MSFFNRRLRLIQAAAIAIMLCVPVAGAAASYFYVDAGGNLGVGTDSPLARLDVMGAIYSRLFTPTDASSLAIDWSSGNVANLVLRTSNTSLTFSNGKAGATYDLLLRQDTTGTRTVTWPASVKWAGGTEPTLTSSASSTDVVHLIYDGTDYLGTFAADFGAAPAGIQFDAASSNISSSPGTSITTAHTVSGDNRVLFVSVTTANSGGGGDVVSGVTYDGTSMTLAGKVATYSGSPDGLETYLYYLFAPAVGSHDIVVSYSSLSGYVWVANASYKNVSQSGLDAVATSSANLQQSSISGSVTTNADNAWVVMGSFSGDGNTSAGAGTTVRATSPTLDRQVLSDGGGPKHPAGSATLSIDNNNDRVASVTAAIAPAP